MKLSREFTKVLAWVLWIFGVLFILRGLLVLEPGMEGRMAFGMALISLGFYVSWSSNSNADKKEDEVEDQNKT